MKARRSTSAGAVGTAVDLSGRVGGALSGRKVLSVIHAGGRCTSHRSCRHAAGRSHGRGAAAPGNGPLDAPFLRAFTFGSIRQRRQGAGRGPGPGLVARSPGPARPRWWSSTRPTPRWPARPKTVPAMAIPRSWAGANGELIMRFDSGFSSNTTIITTLERLEVPDTTGVRT